MKYADGHLAHLGDVVTLSGKRGRVICSIDTDEYGTAPHHSKAQWGYLGEGVMVEFTDFGLIQYIELEKDLQFVRRGTLADAE
jgi:hypothetical protein